MSEDIIGGLTESPPRRWRRKGGFTVIGLIVLLAALLGGAYVGAAIYLGDRVPRGTSVAGVPIGGLTAAAAETRLQRDLAPKAKQNFSVTVNDKSWPIDPAAAGLGLDVPATVVGAGGARSFNPARLLAFVIGGNDEDPVLTVDEAALTQSITTVAEAADQVPKDGAIRFRKGKPVVTSPESGVKVNRAAAEQAITSRFLRSSTIELPKVESEPQITAAAIERAMTDFVEPAMSGPVTLKLGDHRVTAKPQDYLAAITMAPQGRELQPTLDPAALKTALKPAMATVGKRPRDAGFEVVNGKPRIIPARVGVTFDETKISEQFLSAISQPKGSRVLSVDAVTDQPEFTTADAKALGIKRRVSTFTTYFPYAEYRNVNLPRAAALINGTLLKPGETFSLNDTVGERTAANGFTTGFIIKDGIFREDLGGGVSQIATTTFNAAFFAGLEDVEHKPHSVYIDRYPVGREATVAWGHLDLKFKNNTPYGILITANVTKSTPSSSGVATVSMYSTKYWDISTSAGPRTNYTQPKTRTMTGPKCVPSDGLPGFTVNVWRYFRKHGQSAVVRTEKFHTVYIASDRVICKPSIGGAIR